MPSVSSTAAMAREAEGVRLNDPGGDLAHPGIGLVVLLVIQVLNVYKPRGETRFAHRKLDEQRRSVRSSVVAYSQTCPRCGRDFTGDDRDLVADDVVEHARLEHGHALDRDIVLAHLIGAHPFERDD